MFRKFSTVFVVVAMLFQMFSVFGPVATAAAGSFVFPNEQMTPASARITTSQRVTLEGSINNVNPNSISVSVFQIIDDKGDTDPSNDITGLTKLDQTSVVYVNGYSLTVYNLELFPGLNRIMFKGQQNGGEVSDNYYINYRNSPVLSDLMAMIDGQSFPIQDTKTTVVYSNTSKGRTNYDISITGKAPNAEKVTIVLNGNSKTYNVNSSSGDTFVASPVNLKKGKNQVTIRVSNSTQTIETIRDIAFYNGGVTFYDVNIADTTAGAAAPQSLEYRPNYPYTTKGNVQITGKVIVPNSYYDGPDADTLPEPHPDPAVPLAIHYDVTTGTPNYSVSSVVYGTAVPGYNVSDKFFEYQFTINSATLNPASYTDDMLYNMLLHADNEENRRLGITPINEGTTDLGFSLRNGTTAYIYDINYLPGYSSTGYESLSGVDMQGAQLFSMPLGVEVLIGNPAALGAGGLNDTIDPVRITEMVNSAGTSYVPVLNTDYDTKPVVVQTVTKTINGVAQTFGRVILQVDKLPNTGTQTLKFKLNAGSALASQTVESVTVNLLYGPFANFSNASDGTIINVDTTSSTLATDIITTRLNNFRGQFSNIANPLEIRYAPITTGADAGPQTVFFYVNNQLIPLVPVTASNLHDLNFQISASSVAAAYNAMFMGENKIKIVFQSNANYYEKTIKINLVPTNLPVIPAPDTDGVYPYTKELNAPLANDPNFPMSGSIYTTKKSEMNVYGTFDFLDFASAQGMLPSAAVPQIVSKLGSMSSLTNYMLRITSPDLSTPIEWDLTREFEVIKKSAPTGTPSGVVNAGLSANPNLTVRYDTDSQTFSFILRNQKLHSDGSASIYNIYVYNSGITGPRASYRLEVDPTAIPYSIIRPLLPEKSIVNQNFIEVIIDAPGAETVTINKVKAERIDYDSDNDGTPDYLGAYRATVTNLKAGKETKIEYVISNANDSTKDSFTIQYVPTNIPGGQFMETMKSSHKVFDGLINLTFQKGTSLIRTDYNVPANLKNQIFTGHNLLFAVANPEDGVVDRREYETLPANFDAMLISFGTRFRVSYPTHFIKASPTVWIDAGLADDPSTGSYDPLKYGVDPYQFPGATGPGGTAIPTYDNRPDNRELISSKVGTLELKYDESMRDVTGTIMTVFRYDVKGKYWENVGGTVDTKKHTVKVPFQQFGYYVVGKMVYSYVDITQHPYARNFMEAIYAKGIMNPATFDAFGGDQFTERGEFARMMVKGLNLPLDYELSKSHFDDVPYMINPDALWDYRYIETAARQGIIRGTSPRAFEPRAYTTRQAAAVIIARSLNLKLDTDSNKINKDLQKQFKDYDKIDYYARAAVLAVAKKGFILGTPIDPSNPKGGAVFEPDSNLLRSDAAIIMAKILMDQKRLPKIG
ncbi:S-layer homology domain-containing protein [Cohnella panacarvi]|uniref:S-layer homology domain-containing protein n=1 Tax=Cohnella panacarvi TaxID=400776 RepID=UPI00047ED51D|nr:S-layer homology domain-containing protein [Cohnella panacarvi]